MVVDVSSRGAGSLSAAQWRVERNLELSGQAAAEWLADCRIRLRSPSSTLRLLGDRLRMKEFVVARIWHTPCEIELDATHRVSFFTGVAGEYELPDLDPPASVSPGDGAVIRGSGRTLRARRPAAMFLVQTIGSRLPLGTMTSLGGAEARSYEGPMRDALIGAINGFFSTEPPRSPRSLSAWRRATEDLVAAVVESHHHVPMLQASPVHERLLIRALEIIDARAHDLEFSVTALADALNVSQSHLYEVFSATEMSVGLHVRRARATTARRLIEMSHHGATDLEQIAASAGFGSVRTMRRALEWLSSS